MFRKGSAAAMCLLLSLLLHMLLALVLLNLPERKTTKPLQPKTERTIRLQRAEKGGKEEAGTPPPAEKEKPKPFAKTDPDHTEQRPQQEDFVGKRNARAASDADARGYEGDSPLPSMTGEKKEEIVTFDQEQQQGDLEHDGPRRTPETQPAPPPQPPTPPTPPTQPTPQPPIAPAPANAGMSAVSPPPESPDGDVKLATPDKPKEDSEDSREQEQGQDQGRQESSATPPQTAQPTVPPTPPTPQTQPTPVQPTPPVPTPRPAPPFHRDPSLADPGREGFRTHERRSRNAGRFVLGRHAALNVSATPLGRYEEEIYRRIAYWWYRACDEHRGDIIPGKIVVSLRLNSRGQLVNMDLVQRSGAGVIQQSFTFGAIRKASLPPMPPAVREEMVGDLLELIFEFVFN